jgi:hypothetical protein
MAALALLIASIAATLEGTCIRTLVCSVCIDMNTFNILVVHYYTKHLTEVTEKTEKN